MKDNYGIIVAHYENCFNQHGATPKGVDWPNQKDLTVRFEVMSGIFDLKNNNETIKVLDLGCGYGAFYDYLFQKNLIRDIDYTGIDLSLKMINAAKERHPKAKFIHQDILIDRLKPNQFDYVILNGVLTEKASLTQENMEMFAHSIISEAFLLSAKGVAFNVMNEHVDWKRDDLFHWPFDLAAKFLFLNCSRHFTFRSDYGLYEYTTYIYKQMNC